MNPSRASIALACVAFGLTACGGGGDQLTTDASAGQERTFASAGQEQTFAPSGSKIAECAESITGEGDRSPCTLAFETVDLTKCPSGPVGSDVMASGVSCAVAQELLLPAGGFPIAYKEAVETIYRPWLASGAFTKPKPQRPIGWTCFQSFDPKSSAGGVRFVCWNEIGGVVLFTFS